MNVRNDLKCVVRMLTKSPVFTVTVILSLAIGIAGSTAVFSLVDAIALGTLPVRAPHELVEVSQSGGGLLSYPMYEALKARSDAFAGVLAVPPGSRTASLRLGQANAGDGRVSPVSGDYFQVLGVQAVVGRTLTSDDLSASNNTVISHALWQSAFGGDAGVVGKPLRVGARSYTIIGVAAPGFRGVAVGQPIDLWVPITWIDKQVLRNPLALAFHVLARRKPTVSESQARANVALMAQQWGVEWKLEAPMRVEVTPAAGGLTELRRQFMRPLAVLMVVAGLLLLIATANVANLLLVRASGRQREIAMRLALGAHRTQLIRQLLIESFALGVAAAAVGLLFAPAVFALLVRFLSVLGSKTTLAFSLDSRMLAFAATSSIGVVLLFGLAPALIATRLEAACLLRGGPAVSGHERAAGPRQALMIAEVAISCVILVGALLFARSLQHLTDVDLGFRPANILLLQARTLARDSTKIDDARLFERVLERLSRVPGVQAAAFSSETLFSGNTWTEAVDVPGIAPTQGADRNAVLLVTSAGFFKTMGIKLLSGRDFDEHDSERTPRVAVVNEAMARRYLGERDVIGRTFRLDSPDFPEPLTVIGIVHDVRYASLREPPPHMIYIPDLQAPNALASVNIAVRTGPDPERLAALLRKEGAQVSPALRFGAQTTQASQIDATVARERMLSRISSFFGWTAAVLVCIGLYGLTAYEVARRTQEIGVRIALGARRTSILGLVVGRALSLIGVGVFAGFAVVTALVGSVESLLFGIRGTDASTMAGSAAILMTIGAVAAFLPALRAARLDPMRCLSRE